jgi:type 1 glutamine amidotransferase
MSKVLFVGGSPAPWHRIEMTEPPIRAALEGLGLTVDATGIYHPDGGPEHIGDYSAISADNLRNYDAIVLQTDGLYGADFTALIEYVHRGSALAAVHGATIYGDDSEYTALLGAAFARHPEQMDIHIEFTDKDHPVTQGLAPFTVHDELYLYREPPKDVHVLAETKSYEEAGAVPVCWVREPGEGRVFYLSLGHDLQSLGNPNWQLLFQRGVSWTMRQI